MGIRHDVRKALRSTLLGMPNVLQPHQYSWENIAFEKPSQAGGTGACDELGLEPWIDEKLVPIDEIDETLCCRRLIGQMQYTLYWPHGCSTEKIEDYADDIGCAFRGRCIEYQCNSDGKIRTVIITNVAQRQILEDLPWVSLSVVIGWETYFQYC